MKTLLKLCIVAGISFLYFAAMSLAQSKQTVPYPEGYRLWTHVKSGIALSGGVNDGLHNIYANPKAMDGYRSGRFADGSIIVFDFIEVKTNDGVTSFGERRRIDVMHKDSKQFAKTGGWGYEEFRGESRTQRDVGENAAAKCFACHAGQKDRDSVFSSFRE